MRFGIELPGPLVASTPTARQEPLLEGAPLDGTAEHDATAPGKNQSSSFHSWVGTSHALRMSAFADLRTDNAIISPSLQARARHVPPVADPQCP